MPRKLIYYVATSADGFIARKDGSIDWCLFEGEHASNLVEEFPETFPVHLHKQLGIVEGARRFDTVLMGRATYEVGLREGITSPYAPLQQIVVSKTMKVSPDPAVELFGGDPVSLVRKLKRKRQGKDIWLCGGSKLASALFKEIDELILKISPAKIETGIPIFDGRELQVYPTALRRYSNGFVLGRYTLRPRRS